MGNLSCSPTPSDVLDLMALGLVVAACGLTVGDFSATTLSGQAMSLSACVGKPTLILNVASL